MNSTIPTKAIGDLLTAAEINDLRDAVNSKVDKVTGKALSTNDYVDIDKTKVAAIDQVFTTAEKIKVAAIDQAYTSAEKTKVGLIDQVFTVSDKNKIIAIDQVFTAAEKTKVGAIDQVFTAAEKTKVSTIDQTYTSAEKTKVTAIDQAYSSAEKAKVAAIDQVFTSAEKTKVAAIDQVFTSGEKSKLTSLPSSAEPTIAAASTSPTTKVWNGSKSFVELGTMLTAANVAIKVSGTIPEADLPTIPFNPAHFELNGSNQISLVAGGGSGGDTDLAIKYIDQGFGGWMPHVGVTTITSVGKPALAVNGTATLRAYDTSTFLGLSSRVGAISGAVTANTRIGHRLALLCMSRKPGLYMKWRFCNTDAVAVSGASCYVGMTTDTGGLAGVDPSTFLNSIGVGNDTADTFLQIMSNGASGTATKVSLGSNFPANTQSADIYEVVFEGAAAGTTITYSVTRFSASTGAIVGSVATGTISSNLPVDTVAMCPQAWRCNRATVLGTATDLGIDFLGGFIQNKN